MPNISWLWLLVGLFIEMLFGPLGRVRAKVGI